MTARERIERLKDRQDYRRALIERMRNCQNWDRQQRLDAKMKEVEQQIAALRGNK